MPWANDAAARAHTANTYATPEYRQARNIARQRAQGRCEQCGHPHPRLETDHIIAVSAGGTHHPDNLQMLCRGPGTCKCHERKTAQEGRGYRATTASNDPEPRQTTAW